MVRSHPPSCSSSSTSRSAPPARMRTSRYAAWSPPPSLVRKGVKIVEGRPFHEGRNEVIAGRAAAREFAGLEVGNHLRWGDNVWEVVGLFTDGDSVYESEIWTDARVAQPAYRRTGFQSVYARLESPEAFQRFKAALTSDPRLDVAVKREDESYQAQSP